MNCKQFIERMDAFIDNEVSENERIEFEKHAEVCSKCNDELKAALLIREILLPDDRSEEIPLSVRGNWRKAIKAESTRQRKKAIYRAFSGIAAAVILFFCVGALKKPITMPATESSSMQSPVMTSTMVRSDAAKSAEAVDRSIDATETPCYVVRVEDIAQAEKLFDDILNEYALSIISEDNTDEYAEKTVSLPENTSIQDILNALEAIGEFDGNNATDTETIKIRFELE